MSLGDGAPGMPGKKGLLVAAAVLLVIPVAGLMAVWTYASEDPKLFGFPFFFWYQFLWVFLCSAMTYGAHRLVLAARGQSPKDGRRPDERNTPQDPASARERRERS